MKKIFSVMPLSRTSEKIFFIVAGHMCAEPVGLRISLGVMRTTLQLRSLSCFISDKVMPRYVC